MSLQCWVCEIVDAVFKGLVGGLIATAIIWAIKWAT